MCYLSPVPRLQGVALVEPLVTLQNCRGGAGEAGGEGGEAGGEGGEAGGEGGQAGGAGNGEQQGERGGGD